MTTSIFLLLTFAAFISLVCSIGVLAMRGTYDKLHYLAPATILATAAVAAAVMLREGCLSQAGIKSFLVFVVFLLAGPVITQAAARAEHTRTGRGEEQKK